MLVVGPTGYIGRFVVQELIRRGYQVVAFARPKSGIGGRTTQQQLELVRQPCCQGCACKLLLTRLWQLLASSDPFIELLALSWTDAGWECPCLGLPVP